MVGVQEFAIPVVTLHPLIIRGYPYVPVLINECGNQFVALKRNRACLSGGNVNEQCMVPAVTAQ